MRIVSRRSAGVIILAGLVTAACAMERVVIEDWSRLPIGTEGVPPGWQGDIGARPAYDLTIVEEEGRKALHLKSTGESSRVIRRIRDKVNLERTPVLEWSWKAIVLPKGGDLRGKATDDQVATVYVGWLRGTTNLPTRVLGYVWDTTAPTETTVRRSGAGTVTYIVVRSGAADLGKWVTERRNVYQDFEKSYGVAPPDPTAIYLEIASNRTQSSAESYVGPIVFRER